MDIEQAKAMFAAFTAELGDIGAGIGGLEAMVADHVRQCPAALRPQALKDAQALDLLIQRLAALQTVAGVLSRGETVQAALSEVLLAEVAMRLRGAVLGEAPMVAVDAGGGDFVLFD
jgi:hypothetical protein